MMIMSVIAIAVITRTWPLSSDAARRIVPPGTVSPQSRLERITYALNGTDRGSAIPRSDDGMGITPFGEFRAGPKASYSTRSTVRLFTVPVKKTMPMRLILNGYCDRTVT
jgi:hypothetical protein